MNLENLLSVIGFVANHSPAIAQWFSDLADGKKSHADQLRAVLPMESKSGRAARELKADRRSKP